MTSIVNNTGDSTSAAGRPDLGKLAQLGVIQIGPDGWPLGVAKNVQMKDANGQPMTRSITVRIDGVKTRKEIPVQGGHAHNPDEPIWRVGLTPEKYHNLVLKEAEVQATKGNTSIKVAPDLTPEEAEAYLTWLDTEGIEKPSESVLQPMEDAKKEVIARKIKEAKKTSGKSKKA